MKTLFIFSNPFGYGPAGKAVSIGKYVQRHSKNTRVIVCGCKNVLSIAGNQLASIEVDERNQEAIVKLLDSIKGEKYVISSQNRFAIKAAKQCNIQSAFLDGLAWFWNNIPEDHFLADIVFWINYSQISIKIPIDQKHKVIIIGGITEENPVPISKTRNGITFYIGGCKNPLTPLPHSYLDLTAKLLNHAITKSVQLTIVTDNESSLYLSKYKSLTNKIKSYDHLGFLKKISESILFVSNGGQTASMEAVTLNTSLAYFLPVNLSQQALVTRITSVDLSYPALKWENYVSVPKELHNYSEKDAISFFDLTSKIILLNDQILEKLKKDFIKIILPSKQVLKPALLSEIGSTGAKDLFDYLNVRWNLN